MFLTLFIIIIIVILKADRKQVPLLYAVLVSWFKVNGLGWEGNNAFEELLTLNLVPSLFLHGRFWL